MTWYDLDVSLNWFIWPSLLQGLGMGMIFVPLSTVAYATLPRTATDQGSAIFNLARTVGIAVGISLAATVLTHMTQVNWIGSVATSTRIAQRWSTGWRQSTSAWQIPWRPDCWPVNSAGRPACWASSMHSGS